MSRCCWFHRRPETTGSLLSSLVSRVPTELAGSRATWGHGTPQSRVTVHARPRARPQSRLREQRSWLSLLLPTGRAHAVQSPRVGSLWGRASSPVPVGGGHWSTFAPSGQGVLFRAPSAPCAQLSLERGVLRGAQLLPRHRPLPPREAASRGLRDVWLSAFQRERLQPCDHTYPDVCVCVRERETNAGESVHVPPSGFLI